MGPGPSAGRARRRIGLKWPWPGPAALLASRSVRSGPGSTGSSIWRGPLGIAYSVDRDAEWRDAEWNDAMKRMLDLMLAVCGLLALWPVLAACAVAVKIDSPGPVFYRGVRTGRYGRPFRIWKFRSMVIDAEARGGTTTGDEDPRITRVGRVLRRYKLDELPQLWNVLWGEMSFVGPRPEVAEYTDGYSAEERRILDVRPGITDLSSIEFRDLQSHVGARDPDEVYRREILPRKNRLRLQYVERQSLALDLSILLRTVSLLLLRPLRGG